MAITPSPAGSAPSPAVPATGAVRKDNKAAPPFLAMAAIIVSLLILAAVGIFVVYPQMKAARHWRKAQEALDGYYLQEARDHLQQCVEVWPTSGETYFLLARTCRRLNDLDNARQYLRKAKEMRWVPQQIQLESYLIQAQTLFMPWVEEKLRGFLENKHPDERLILEGLVMACLKSNLLKRALQWTTVWLEHHPDDWEAHYLNGSIFEAGFVSERAIKEFQEALKQRPNFPPIQFHLAQAYLSAGRYGQALPHFQEYLKSEAGNPTALVGLARCQRAEGFDQDAKATLEKVFAIDSQNAEGYLLESQLALDEDDFVAARDWLEKALRLAPHDRVANEEMGTILRHEAAGLDNRNRPHEAEEKRKQAELYDKKNQQITDAANRIRDILQELLGGPDNVILRTEAGTTLMQVGQYDQAFHWLISALLVDPNHRPAKEALGKCLKELGNRKLEQLYQPLLRGEGSLPAIPVNGEGKVGVGRDAP